MPDEVLAALQNDDWAARLEMWNRRAVTAEAEVERLEEALLEEQRNSTFTTMTSNLAAQSEAGTPMAGFSRAGSANTYRSATMARGASISGTLSASWGPSAARMPRSAAMSETTNEMVAEDDGWLYDRAGKPLRMTWDLVGMVLDVAAWGPDRCKRGAGEDPARVIKALKTLIKSWKALWEKGIPVKSFAERDRKAKSGAAPSRNGGGGRSARSKDGAGDDVKATLIDLSSRLHRTEQTLQKVLTPSSGNTPIAGGFSRASSAGRRGGRGGGADEFNGLEDHGLEYDRRASSNYDSDHTVLDEDVYDSAFFEGQGRQGSYEGRQEEGLTEKTYVELLQMKKIVPRLVSESDALDAFYEVLCVCVCVCVCVGEQIAVLGVCA